MKRVSLALLTVFSICMVIHASVPYLTAFAQLDDTSKIISTNESTDPQVLNNQTRIMQNTSGIIDDVIDALKDSFGPIFGK